MGKCGQCHGKKTVECANCKGKGKVDKGGFLNTNWKPCDVCNGSGKVKCPSCGGSGYS